MSKFIIFKIRFLSIAIVLVLYTVGCVVGSRYPISSNPGRGSTATGLEYNKKPEDGASFQVSDYRGQPAGPNLLFIEGGRAVIGSFEEDIMFRRDNIERAVTVSSFFLDETEIANIHWLEFEYYLKLDSSKAFWKSNIPDTTVWAKDLAYNDPYVSHYYRYPGYRFYPVVGINWVQANNYCLWRTQVVNAKLAQEAGIVIDNFDSQVGGGGEDDEFAEEDVVEEEGAAEEGGGGGGGGSVDISAAAAGGRIPLESGVVLPNYRLPSEAEWEYAAKALIGTQWLDENQTHNRLYPWDGHSTRNPFGNSLGYFLANYKRGLGDYAGIAGKLNDGEITPTYIYNYPPNDYGLYNMAGNVNEWVQDVYRPLSFQDMDDLNPVRRDATNDSEKGYDAQYNFIGNEKPYTEEEAIAAGISAKLFNADNPPIRRLRVYKGGSWKDVAYWLAQGTRRAEFEDRASAAIGFRCAMTSTSTNY